MRLSSSIMILAGAIAVLLTFNEAESFTLGRNITVFLLDVDDHDSSNETITDHHLDSMELTQNETSIENLFHDSLENNSSKLIQRDFELLLLNQSTNASLVIADDISSEDLELKATSPSRTIASDHQLHKPIGSLKVKGDLVKRNAPVSHLLIQQDGRSHTVHQTGLHFTDHSLEDQVVISPEDILLFSALEQQPITGIFSHPLSDDLYLVKEYLGDYYFWEIDDELARAYLMQLIKMKDITKFSSHIDARPKKLNAIHLNQFTLVQPVVNEQIQAPNPAL